MSAKFLKIMACLLCALCVIQSRAEEKRDFRLGEGDSIHIAVFRNPELALDTRITDGGTISYPLIGAVKIGGLTVSDGEALIARRLKDGGFVQDPQVNITLVTMRANLVSVLGQVTRPGLYPLDSPNLHLSEVLAIAGGVAQSGGDRVIVKGMRNGAAFRKEVDLPAIFLDGKDVDDIIIAERDEIYVPVAPMFYIYGEVQRPGAGVVLRDMTVIQALAQGGGLTPRGTERDIQLHRRTANGEVEKLHPAMTDRIQANDVLYVHESLF